MPVYGWKYLLQKILKQSISNKISALFLEWNRVGVFYSGIPLECKISGSLPSPQPWLCWWWSVSWWAHWSESVWWPCPGLVRQVGASRGQQWWEKGNASWEASPGSAVGLGGKWSPSEGLGSVHHILQPLQGSGVACLPLFCPQSSSSPAGAPQKHESFGPTAAQRAGCVRRCFASGGEKWLEITGPQVWEGSSDGESSPAVHLG